MAEGQNRSCCSMFSLFFCPPCPTQITEKLIFMPPSPPFYEMDEIKSDSGCYAFMISPEADTSGLKNVVKQDARFVKTRLENDIVVLFVACTRNKKFTILYSHGNAVDLGQIHKLCVEMSLLTGCDFVSYDYSGYGQSKGRPTEKNLYADIKAAWDYTLTFHEPRPEKIILFGQSLGSAPTLDLASKVQCAGVILQSAFLSSLHVACPNRSRISSCANRFKNIEKVPKVTSPVLVIHGTNDEIIDLSHGKAIYESCPQAVEPLWVEGAGHNDIEVHGQYMERIRKFINEELAN